MYSTADCIVIIENLPCPVQYQTKEESFASVSQKLFQNLQPIQIEPHAPQSPPIQWSLTWFSPDLLKWAGVVATSVYCWFDRWLSCWLNWFKSAFWRGQMFVSRPWDKVQPASFIQSILRNTHEILLRISTVIWIICAQNNNISATMQSHFYLHSTDRLKCKF